MRKSYLFSIFIFLNFSASIAYSNVDILYIGDSHSHTDSLLNSRHGERFPHRFIEGVRSQNQTVAYYASCGSRPSSWTRGPSNMCGNTILEPNADDVVQNNSRLTRLPSFSDLVETHSPSSVVINLGDNMFSYSTANGYRNAQAPTESTSPSRSSVIEEIKNMIKNVPEGSKCLWVGPAYHPPGRAYNTNSNGQPAYFYSKSNAEVDRMYALITEALENSNCRLVDSRNLINSTQGNDGLHFVGSESQTLGTQVARIVTNQNPLRINPIRTSIRPTARPPNTINSHTLQ